MQITNQTAGWARRKRASRAAAAVAAGLLLLFGGSTPALAAAPAGPVVSGRILLPSGAPAIGVRVTLVHQVGAGDALFGIFASALTLGIACITQSVQLCQQNALNSATATDGGYHFAVGPGDLTNSVFGVQRTFSLGVAIPAAPGEATGPAASATFKVGTASRRLPDLQVWHPGFTPGAGAQVRPHWDPLPSTYLGAASYDLLFTTTTHQPIWDYPQAVIDAPIDGRLLEDATGMAQVVAQGSGGDISYGFQSQGIAFASAAGAPLSRGRACALVDAAGNRQALSPCAYTDGDLVSPASLPPGTLVQVCPSAPAKPASRPPSGSASPAPACTIKNLEVDLGSDQYISMVVLRGCPSCRVQGSLGSHGSDWHDLGDTSAGGALVLPAGTRAQTIRVIPPTASALTGTREVSVWAGSAPAPLPIVGGTLAGGGPLAAIGTGLRAAGSTGIVGLGVLALVVCSGIAYLLGRRGERALAMRHPTGPEIPVEPARPISAPPPVARTASRPVRPGGRPPGRGPSAGPGSGARRGVAGRGRGHRSSGSPPPPGPGPS